MIPNQTRPNHDNFVEAINNHHPKYREIPRRRMESTTVHLYGKGSVAVIHLPVNVDSPTEAIELAARLTASLVHVPELHGHDVLVSMPNSGQLLTVYCDRVRGAGRCFKRYRHDGECEVVPSKTD